MIIESKTKQTLTIAGKNFYFDKNECEFDDTADRQAIEWCMANAPKFGLIVPDLKAKETHKDEGPTYKELKEIADGLGLDYKKNIKKVDLIELITDATTVNEDGEMILGDLGGLAREKIKSFLSVSYHKGSIYHLGRSGVKVF